MVHRRKIKKEHYVTVTALGGTAYSPFRETFIVKGEKKIIKKINLLARRPEVKQIRVEKNGFAYLRGFTGIGWIETIQAMRKDDPKVKEIVYLRSPKSMFEPATVVRVDKGKRAK